jgi:hypothetical protein
VLQEGAQAGLGRRGGGRRARAGALGILASATSRHGDQIIQLALFEMEELQKFE